MNDEFAKRVQAAAVAGWWALLIASLFLAVQWPIYLWVMSTRPAWVLSYWGQGVTWPIAQMVWLWSVAVFKTGLWMMAAVVLWLTLWARRLRQA